MKNVTSVALAISTLTSLAGAQNPQPYCTAGTSTNGCTPSINANVQPNTTNNAGCVITTSGVEGQKQGILFYGVDNTGFAPTPWGFGSTSFLCAKPPTTRLGGPVSSGGSVGQCDGSYVLDWDAFQVANPSALGNPWLTGDKVFVQSWYRDPSAPRTSNFSNALELTHSGPPPVPCLTALPGMILIPAGTFMMGSNAANGTPYNNHPISQPVHQVTLSYCFWMGAKEVTQAQYTALMGVNPSFFIHPANPVERVTWTAARSYCAALTAQQAALGLVPPGYEFRLPTEAEWEYACRAGTTTEFNVGAGLYCNQATPIPTARWASPRLWAVTRRTRGACTTCTATCGSGVSIRSLLTPRRLSRIPSSRAGPSASFAAAVSRKGPTDAVLRTGFPASHPAFSTTRLGYGSSSPQCSSRSGAQRSAA
jgi:hypothetical protein